MPETDLIEDYVAGHLLRQNIPGLSLAVLRDGELVLAKGYGLADLEQSRPATAETIYEIGSATKPITATAILQLVEKGMIDLDSPVGQTLDDIPAAWTAITVRQLLTHTSGIRSYTQGVDLLALFRSNLSPSQLLEPIAGLQLDFAPGRQWAYSNTNFILLGMMLEKVTGRSYWEYVEQTMFKPLGMTSTGASGSIPVRDRIASGYGRAESQLVKREPITPTAAWAAGSLVSTVVDLARWIAALMSGRLVRAETLEQMWTRHALGTGVTSICGLGWVVDTLRGHPQIWHNGGTAGFHSVVSLFPDQALAVVILTNLAEAAPEGMAKGIAGLLDSRLLPPSMMPAEPDPDPKRAEQLFQFLKDYAADNGRDQALMTPGCLTATIPAWRRLAASRLEAVQNLTYVGSDEATDSAGEANEDRIVRHGYYRTESDRETRTYTFALTADGKVADFFSDV